MKACFCHFTKLADTPFHIQGDEIPPSLEWMYCRLNTRCCILAFCCHQSCHTPYPCDVHETDGTGSANWVVSVEINQVVEGVELLLPEIITGTFAENLKMLHSVTGSVTITKQIVTIFSKESYIDILFLYLIHCKTPDYYFIQHDTFQEK